MSYEKHKILVLGGNQYKNLMYKFGDVKDNIADFKSNPKDYELVLFHGGADVSPELYKDKSPKGFCYADSKRDKIDMGIFKIARANNIKMVGICRGSQFLNVFAGGKLIHHLNGHTNAHSFSSRKGETFLVSSTHHQMIIPAPGSHLIGWSTKRLSDIYLGKNDEMVAWDGKETEAVIFPRINACGVQFHPEIMGDNSFGKMWFYSMVKCFMSKPMEVFISEYTNSKYMKTQKAG